MTRRTLLFVASVAVGLMQIACEKIEDTPRETGALKLSPAKFANAIPAEYGELVGVTPHPGNPEWAAAWFQKPDQTIMVVWVDIVHGKIDEKVLEIPRR